MGRALRRLGGGKKTTAQKLKEKKRIREGKETKKEKKAREDMARLTGMADAILSRSGEKGGQALVGNPGPAHQGLQSKQESRHRSLH